LRPKSTRRPIPLRSQWSRHSRQAFSPALVSCLRFRLDPSQSRVHAEPRLSEPPHIEFARSPCHRHKVALKTPLSTYGHEKSTGHPLRPAATPLSSKLVSRCRHKTRNSQWSSSGRVVNSYENRATISLDLLAARLHIYGGSEGSGAALRETRRNERDTRQPGSLSTKGEFENEQH
jgi:hypothetical protein